MKTSWLKLIALLVIMICYGCQKENKGKVEIYILTKDVHCLDIDGKSSYLTDDEKNKSLNKVRFKIVNNTDKVQLLVFNPYDSGFSDLMPEIKGRNGKINKYFPGIADHFDDPDAMAYSDCILTVLQDKFKLYENSGSKNIPVYIYYKENQVLLQPGEERTFQTPIYLPVLSTYVNRFTIGRTRFNGVKNGDSLYLKYSTYVPRHKNALPDWELKELNAKGINFYADTIKSNAIPIRIIK